MAVETAHPARRAGRTGPGPAAAPSPVKSTPNCSAGLPPPCPSTSLPSSAPPMPEPPPGPRGQPATAAGLPALAHSTEPGIAAGSPDPPGAAASRDPSGAAASGEPVGVALPGDPPGAAASGDPSGPAGSGEPVGLAAPGLPVVTTCPVCLGYGYVRLGVPVGDPQFGRMEPCEACGIVLRHRISIFDRHSSRKGRALEQRFRNFRVEGSASAATNAYNAAVAFAAEPRGWLVIHGPMGNGKSHLAAAIANHLIETRRIPTLFLTVPDLLEALRREIQGSLQGSPAQHSPLLDVARAAPVLILDDLGAERLTEWAIERLYLLLDHRYVLGSPTVLITNVPLENLPARIYSRLGDRALSTVVHNPAPDYRWGHGRVTR